MTAANRLSIGVFPPGPLMNNPAFTNFTIDASGERIGYVFSMPDAATITHLGFRYGARTGTPPTYRISLQALNGTGEPDGTVLGGGSPASATFTPPADATWNSTWQWVALSNSYATTRGQLLAVVIDYSAGTIDASNNSSFTQYDDTGLFLSTRTGIPYPIDYNGSAWTKRSAQTPIYGLKSASAVYGIPLEAVGAVGASTTGHRVALKFTLPSGWGDTFKVIGARWTGCFQAGAAGSVRMGLWDATSLLQGIDLDNEHSVNPSSAARVHEYYFDDDPTALSFGTAYYLGLERIDANNSPELNCVQVDTSNELLAFSGGAAFHLATYNGSAWSDDQTRRPGLEILLDDITEPAGGGGGLLTPSGFCGGMHRS